MTGFPVLSWCTFWNRSWHHILYPPLWPRKWKRKDIYQRVCYIKKVLSWLHKQDSTKKALQLTVIMLWKKSRETTVLIFPSSKMRKLLSAYGIGCLAEVARALFLCACFKLYKIVSSYKNINWPFTDRYLSFTHLNALKHFENRSTLDSNKDVASWYLR